MLNFVGNPLQVAAANAILAANLALPNDVDPNIVQPTGPIVGYCWVIAKNISTNQFKCKICGVQFPGSGISNVGSYFRRFPIALHYSTPLLFHK